MRYGVLFFIVSLITFPMTTFGSSEPFHLNCSWIDDKFIRGINDNGSTTKRTPLPDIKFQFSKLQKHEKTKVTLPKFMKIDPPEKFFSITQLSEEEIIVQECLEPFVETEEAYTRFQEFLGRVVDYDNYLKNNGVCKRTNTRGFKINRITGELEVETTFTSQPSGIFIYTETWKETYFWYQCEKVERKF